MVEYFKKHIVYFLGGGIILILWVMPLFIDSGSGPSSKINCYNQDGKVVYTEEFPNGTHGNNYTIRAYTKDGRGIWFYSAGSLMCREEEILKDGRER